MIPTRPPKTPTPYDNALDTSPVGDRSSLGPPSTPRVSISTMPSPGRPKSSISTASGASDGTIAEDLPPWDRSVDVFWSRKVPTTDHLDREDDLAFQENCVRLAEESAIINENLDIHPLLREEASRTQGQRRDRTGKVNSRYFQLPDRVRFMIAKNVVESHSSGKAIRLNSPVFLYPVWPVNRKAEDKRIWSTDYFDSLDKVLTSLKAYTSVCFAMRVDILTTLFLTRRFHVVFSPFVTEETQPAAVLYFNRYAPLMKLITLELDLTKLGGSWRAEAVSLDMDKNLERVRRHVDTFASRQRTRRLGTSLQNLVVLVRRYYGFRPVDASGSRTSTVVQGEQGATASALGDKRSIPYCDNTYLSILDPIATLTGIVDSACIVGTDKPYAHKLVLGFWGRDRPKSSREMGRYCHYRTPSCTYPFTPGQSSALDYGPPHGIQIVRHTADPRKWQGMYGCSLGRDVAVTPASKSTDAQPSKPNLLPLSLLFTPSPPTVLRELPPQSPRMPHEQHQQPSNLQYSTSLIENNASTTKDKVSAAEHKASTTPRNASRITRSTSSSKRKASGAASGAPPSELDQAAEEFRAVEQATLLLLPQEVVTAPNTTAVTTITIRKTQHITIKTSHATETTVTAVSENSSPTTPSNTGQTDSLKTAKSSAMATTTPKEATTQSRIPTLKRSRQGSLRVLSGANKRSTATAAAAVSSGSSRVGPQATNSCPGPASMSDVHSSSHHSRLPTSSPRESGIHRFGKLVNKASREFVSKGLAFTRR